jgi:hypothetical protein
MTDSTGGASLTLVPTEKTRLKWCWLDGRSTEWAEREKFLKKAIEHHKLPLALQFGQDFNAADSKVEGHVMLRVLGESLASWRGKLGHQILQSMSMSASGHLDALWFHSRGGDEGGQWLAVHVLPEALLATLATHGLVKSRQQDWRVDPSGSGLLIGAHPDFRGLAMSIAKFGIQRVYFADTEMRGAERGAEDLKARLLGVEVEAIDRNQLTQLPAECSIAICCVDPQNPTMVEDLSYLNFLTAGSIWVDWTYAARGIKPDQKMIEATGAENVFDVEIQAVGAQALPALHVAMMADYTLLTQMYGVPKSSTLVREIVQTSEELAWSMAGL